MVDRRRYPRLVRYCRYLLVVFMSYAVVWLPLAFAGEGERTGYQTTIEATRCSSQQGGSVRRELNDFGRQGGFAEWTVDDVLVAHMMAKLEVAAGGRLQFLNSPAGLRRWNTGRWEPVTGQISLDLPPGQHEIILAVDRRQ